MPAQVLLVDDDEFARGFVRAVLERAGFDVCEAENMATAVSMTRSWQPMAVVTDWNMPDGDGGALARHLHETAAKLPVILITGDALRIEQLPEGEKREFASILHKPFSPSALERAIRAVTTDGSPITRD